MFWYSSNVTLESKVFLRATFMFLFGVRAWAVAVSSAKALKKRIFALVVRLPTFCVFFGSL